MSTSWPVMSIAEAHARLTAPGAPFEIEETVSGQVRRFEHRLKPDLDAAGQVLLESGRLDESGRVVDAGGVLSVLHGSSHQFN